MLLIQTRKLVDRTVFQKLLSIVKPKDTIVFDSVSRMSRNAKEGFKLYKYLYNKDVNLIFLKERYIDTDTYKQAANKQIDIQTSSGDKATDELIKNISEAINKYVLSLAEKQIFLAFEQSQKEVDDLRVRTKEGIEIARRNGKQIGRVKGNKYTSKKEPIVKEGNIFYKIDKIWD
ncbi:MAG: recombinase family protein [Erysipelotrichaceae bacterium]|nr:recombinase family protein [Erysipelotrichaceae bacterium]